MKLLTLSIVIPAYNESRYLDACLKTIENQKVKPDEVIVVDNNSTDKTIQIAKKYPFVTIVPEKHQGIVYARNKGFDSAKSEIIARIDADTLLPSNWVAKIKSFYEAPGHDNYAWTSEGYFYNISLHRFNSWLLTQIAFRFNRILLGHYALWGSTMAITKDQWEQVKNSTCVRNDIHEDLDLAIHLHQKNIKITYDTSIKVAVVMRRVLTDRQKLWDYLMLWPRTLRVHHKKTWLLGMVGAVLLYLCSPIIIFNNKFSNLNWRALIKKIDLG